MSSSYCAAMKQAYESLKKSIENLYGELSDCSTAVANAIPCMEKIIINHEQIDYGKMSEFSSSLDTIKTNLESIVTECDNKIAYWEAEYQKALAAEEAAAKKNSSGTSDSQDSSSSDIANI